MQLKPLAKISKEDIEMCRALSTVISQGDFEVKGNAVIKIAQIFNWFNGLEDKLNGVLKQQLLDEAKAKAPKVKKIKDK
jgi:hypothetical protein